MSLSQSHKSTPTKITQQSVKSLNEVVNVPGRDYSLVGVILDATGNYKTDDSFDYVCKIKVIDKEFNPTQKNSQNVQPFLMVFVFTQKLKDSPVITKIGDVIMLRKFNFDTYQDIVKGIHKRNKSSWFVFDAQDNSPNPIPIVGSSLQNFSMSPDEKKRILAMRQFSKHFFANQDLLKLAWYTSTMPSNMAVNQIYELKDIDLLVKIVSCVEFILDRNTYYKIAFVDQKKNMYLSELINVYGFKNLEKDTVLKLRSIRVQLVNNSYRIDFYDYSDILVLPSHFYNAKEIQNTTKDVVYNEDQLEDQFLQDFHLEKYEKEQISQNTYLFKLPDDTTSNIKLKELQKSFGILRSFNLDRNCMLQNDEQDYKSWFGSLVKKEHANLKFSTLTELNKILNKHKSAKDKIDKQDFEKVFRVRVTIEKIKHTIYNKCIQKFDTKKDEILPLKAPNNQNMKPILYNILYFKDTLSQSKISAYLFTLDGNGNFIFDLWETLPHFSKVENFDKKTSQLNEFSNLLKKLEQQQKEYDICLQLIETQGGAFVFRIIDSIFWFV